MSRGHRGKGGKGVGSDGRGVGKEIGVQFRTRIFWCIFCFVLRSGSISEMIFFGYLKATTRLGFVSRSYAFNADTGAR